MNSSKYTCTSQCYRLLVNLIEADADIKEHICSNSFKQSLCDRSQKPTTLSLSSIELDLFLRFIDAAKRNLISPQSIPSLEIFLNSLFATYWKLTKTS